MSCKSFVPHNRIKGLVGLTLVTPAVQDRGFQNGHDIYVDEPSHSLCSDCIARRLQYHSLPLLLFHPHTPPFYSCLHVVQEYGRGVKEGFVFCCPARHQWMIRGFHSESGEMLTQLCPARYCWRFPSILHLLNRAPVRCCWGMGGVVRSYYALG